MGHDPKRYDFDAIFSAARLAGSRKAEDLPAIMALLGHADSGVRYWGATGLLIHGKAGYETGHEALVKALADECGSVAIVAAESLGRFGEATDREKALDLLLSRSDQGKGNVFEAILALNAVDYLDDAARSRLDLIRQLPRKPDKPAPRVGGYVDSLLKDLVGEER